MRNEPVPAAAPDLDAYFAEQGRRPPRYTGQLEPGFQHALERRYRSVQEADCAFLQTVQLAEDRVLRGDWDLRGYEHDYLGNVPLWGKRVLLYGSASGSIASYIAARAAELVVVDLPPGETPPLLMRGRVPDGVRQAMAEHYERLRRGFWFIKRELGFAASVVYARFADLPADIGRVDVAILPFVLSLTPDPYRVLARAAGLAGEAVVVTELLAPVPFGNGDAQFAAAVFAPSPFPAGLLHWWQLAPYTVSQMAATLELTEPEIRAHQLPGAASAPQFYTVVARRPQEAPAKAAGEPAATDAAKS
jgi:hypothetical protein